MQYAGLELENPFVAAPMAGVSSPAFRLMARRGGASLVYSEMISATGLLLGKRKTEHLMWVLPAERPVCLQLFGSDPEKMHQAARLASSRPVDLIDVNLGCPARKVRRQGAGAALLEDPPLAAEVVSAVVEGSSLPVTAKLRLGRSKNELDRIVPGLLAAGVAGLCLHARTTVQGYSGEADWQAIKRLKQESPVPVIGNGDVRKAADGVRMLAETGCDLVMIGRAARGDPWIFGRAVALLQGRPEPVISLAQRRRALWEHMELARGQGGERHALHFARQFVMWYSRGLPDSAAFRRQAGPVTDLDRLVLICDRYFDRLMEEAV